MGTDETVNGIVYDWGPASKDGAWFVLYPIKGTHTEEDVKKAKRRLRQDRDVLSIDVIWWH